MIWPVLQQDAAFGREVFLTTAPQIERSSAAWSLRLSEDAAADAYIWLETQFPQSKDKEEGRREGRFSGVTPRETVAELRDSLRSNLAMRGTRAAQAAIERIGQIFPNHDVISFARINAKEATLQGTWVPLSPGKVLAFWPKPGRGSLRPTSSVAPVTVFLSYAPADMDLAKALSDDHLALLKRQGIIRAWHEGLVEPGHEWEEETRRHLEESAMILLLISAKFNASDRCYVDHLDSAMRRHNAGQARVIPILLKSCDWTGAPYGKLEPLPRNRKPVTAWRDRNEALAAVAGELRSLLEKHSNDAEG